MPARAGPSASRRLTVQQMQQKNMRPTVNITICECRLVVARGSEPSSKRTRTHSEGENPNLYDDHNQAAAVQVRRALRL
jgi:hypothetical protein